MLNHENIKKIHVVFMTHFDMGFTDYAARVLARYTDEFIPQAIELAEELNRDGEKKFVWTIGAFLIAHYLEQADDEQEKKLCRAIERGDIGWHGLAFTTHTELMDADLLDFDLSYADALDLRFGKKTVAAKLTDVPGHTRAMIGTMARHEKRYLHVGVNPSSLNPEVPPTFVWKSGEHEILVQYSSDYGSTCYAEEMDQVLEFVFLGDNQGIPSRETVLESLQVLKKKYPNGEVSVSTLDGYAEELWKYKDRLPVIREEIGDTWIHGIASDPQKVSRFKQLLALKDQWMQEGRLAVGQPEYAGFMEKLLMVCEHTWGMDYKKYLFDFKNWSKQDFIRARQEDLVTDEGFTERNTALLHAILAEKSAECLRGTYKSYEASYEEQRRYLTEAVSVLPESLQKEVTDVYAAMEIRKTDRLKGGAAVLPYQVISPGYFHVSFDGSGAMVYLESHGKKWIQSGCFGRFSYQIYSVHDTVSEYYQYNHGFSENMTWSEADFSKPGIETVEHLETKNYLFGLCGIRTKGNVVELELSGNSFAVSEYGCPSNACIRYTFGDEILCELIWSGKDANRMPEGLWFDVNIDVENPCLWEMGIMGEQISPLHVVRGGNRRQHCVEKLRYDGADGNIEIRNPDSPLVSMGGKRLYGGCRELPDLEKGFSYCLFNNKWGTNFPMWCEDDGYFRYHLKIK